MSNEKKIKITLALCNVALGISGASLCIVGALIPSYLGTIWDFIGKLYHYFCFFL
jgi:hypothetical protein